MLPFWARVDLRAMAMKGCSASPKALSSDCLVSYPGHSLEVVLSLCRGGAVSVFILLSIIFAGFFPAIAIRIREKSFLNNFALYSSSGGSLLPPTGVQDMTLNNLMVRFQWCSRYGECGVPLHCHHPQVHSGPGVVAPNTVLSMGLRFQLSANKWLMLNWIDRNRTVNHLTACKQMTDV